MIEESLGWWRVGRKFTCHKIHSAHPWSRRVYCIQEPAVNLLVDSISRVWQHSRGTKFAIRNLWMRSRLQMKLKRSRILAMTIQRSLLQFCRCLTFWVAHSAMTLVNVNCIIIKFLLCVSQSFVLLQYHTIISMYHKKTACLNQLPTLKNCFRRHENVRSHLGS